MSLKEIMHKQETVKSDSESEKTVRTISQDSI
jgi:hypothetical protein